MPPDGALRRDARATGCASVRFGGWFYEKDYIPLNTPSLVPGPQFWHMASHMASGGIDTRHRKLP
jgi:hypothetical protein